MADITQEQIERAIKTTCATVLKNEHYFSDLDGLAGDRAVGRTIRPVGDPGPCRRRD